MASSQSKKEAIRAFKERRPPAGVFALRCAGGGECWVGASTNLEAAKNRIWFSLRQGTHPDGELQRKWQSLGEEAFRLEVVESLDPETPLVAVADTLAEKKQQWRISLKALPL